MALFISIQIILVRGYFVLPDIVFPSGKTLVERTYENSIIWLIITYTKYKMLYCWYCE